MKEKIELLPSFRSEGALKLFIDLLNDPQHHPQWRNQGEACLQATARIAVERIDALIEALIK